MVSQRSYENRGGHDHRSDSNRGSNQFNGDRSSNRSDGYRNYDSRQNQNTRNPFGAAPSAAGRADNAPQQNNDAPEPMEYEMIDWQAAARESVCIDNNN